MRKIKRRFASGIAVLLFIAFCGCGKTDGRKSETAEEAVAIQTESVEAMTENPAEIETDEVTESAAEDESPELPFTKPAGLESDYNLSDYEAYHDVVNRYYYVTNAQWSQDALAEAGLNYQVAFCYEGEALQNVGYSLTDVNGDGIPELMICPVHDSETSTEPVLFEMYTISEGEAVRVFTGLEKDVYLLTDYGMIYNRNSTRGSETIRTLSTLNRTELQTEMEIRYDEQTGLWTCDGEPTDETSANGWIETIERGIVSPKITPLTDFE